MVNSQSPWLHSIDVGSTFDAYEILALLARGGMANVWLARQRMKHGLETIVAIKTILPEFSLDPKFQTMFLDEARIACRIDHPNVARLLDVGEAQGSSYIVMEYVGGESLSRLRRTFARMNKTLPLAHRAARDRRICARGFMRRTSSSGPMASRSTSCTATCRRRTCS